MAPKKALRLPDSPPPPPESEEEEDPSQEESGESEEEGEESEEESEVEEKEEQKANTPQIQPSQVNKKPSAPPPAPQSEEEDEEGSESEEEVEEEEEEESDSPPSPNVSDFTVKPISPMKPAAKDSKPTPKRPSDAQKDDEKDLRNRKKTKTIEGEEKKEKTSAVSASGGGGVGRVWSEDDEIAVLQGMIDYQNKNGADPSNDMAAFHEFIRGKLHADFSKTQLYEKVRRFKKKFFTNLEKAENGDDPVFSKPHEYKTFDLSKRIWGAGSHRNGDGVDNVNEKNNNGKVKKGGKIGSISGMVKEGEKKGVAKVGSISGIVKEGEKGDVAMDDLRDDAGDFWSKYPNLSQSFDLDGSSFLPDGVRIFLKDNLSLIDSVKARELDEKWKKLREREAEFFLNRMTLMTEQTKLVLNAGKKR